MIQYHLTRRSHNTKTGPIPVSTTSAESCPESCPLRGAGCYAGLGHLAMHWRAVANGRGSSLEAFCDALESLPAGEAFRHNQAGDLPQVRGQLDGDACRAIAESASHLRGWTYTHHEPTPQNLPILREVHELGLAVNLSADNLEEADELAETGLPVVVLVTRDTPERFTTPDGRRGVVCPAQTGRAPDCRSCLLCQARNRRALVGFWAHGSQAAVAERVTS